MSSQPWRNSSKSWHRERLKATLVLFSVKTYIFFECFVASTSSVPFQTLCWYLANFWFPWFIWKTDYSRERDPFRFRNSADWLTRVWLLSRHFMSTVTWPYWGGGAARCRVKAAVRHTPHCHKWHRRKGVRHFLKQKKRNKNDFPSLALTLTSLTTRPQAISNDHALFSA